MAYPTLKKPNQNIDKIANLQKVDEAGMIAVCMYNLKRILKQGTTFYLGNGNYTFILTTDKTTKCDVCYIKSEASDFNAYFVSQKIQGFLINPEKPSKDAHAVFNFLRNAEIKTKYFQ